MTRQPRSARFSLRLCALSAALLLAVGGTAMANEVKQDLPRAKDGPSTKAANTPAFAPNARLAALIKAGGNIVRQKNVASVTNPKVGLYCITPTAGSNISPRNSIVMLTPEYFFSDINEIKVQWLSRNSGCGAGAFAVVTLADFNVDGFYGRSNIAAFSIVVP